MSRSKLFTPFHLGGLDLANRIIVGPMCQYSADAGKMNDWHLIHLGQLALSGAALLIAEATAVSPDARITDGDVGLYSGRCATALAHVLDAIRRWSQIPFGIQLSHAGRKGSHRKPWHGGEQIPPTDPDGWPVYAASPIAPVESGVPPIAMDHNDLKRIRADFAAAAHRASQIGFDLIQIHAGHGYLLHNFLSPLSNQRSDEYGGSLKNRMRFPLEIFDAVRQAFRPDRPVTVRISATDWVAGGWSIGDSIALVDALRARGCAGVDVSSGGASPLQSIPVGPGYQLPLARAIKQACALPVTAVGLITEPEQAEMIVGTGDADLIGVARAMLFNPHWPWEAAARLGGRINAPAQYLRSQPARFSDLLVNMDTRT
jgi:2,4-dienoyl-CoA reductase-like NADH-dependent reductase (Old Yellow Enzyme family)